MSLSPADSAPPTRSTRTRNDSASSPRDASCGNELEYSFLANEIGKLLDKNPIGLDNEYQYVPEDDLRTLLSLKIIEEALVPTVEPDLAYYILTNARKTFATLHVVFEQSGSSRIRAMQTFKERSFTDETLLSKTFFKCESDCEAVEETCQHYFPSQEPWSPISFSQFAHQRWKFLVPVFDHETFQYNFHHQQMLPWRGRVDNANIGSGNFSEVSCLRMISKHQKLLLPLSDGTVIVARKTLKRMDDVHNYNIREEWLEEVKAHKELNGRSNHLVRGIAAYQLVNGDAKHDTYHLILEWAGGGNLRTFWAANSKPQLDNNVQRSRERVRDLLKQFRGLVEALECMHFGAPSSSSQQSGVSEQESVMSPSNPRATSEAPSLPMIKVQDSDIENNSPEHQTRGGASGARDTSTATLAVPGLGKLVRRVTMAKNWRHGDIKPENILRFTNPESGTDQGIDTRLGTLKLADLGRAQEHLLKTALRNTIEKERWRTRYYEPPDLSSDLQQQFHGKISRLFDIWSLGCVIFEGALWMLYGTTAIAKFHATNSTNTENFIGTPYWVKTGPSKYRVTDAAFDLMDHVIKDGTYYSHAIADLVRLVRDKLLVVDLPPDSESYTPGCRTHAGDMGQELDRILDMAKNDDAYLFSRGDGFNAQLPTEDVTNARQFPPSRPSGLLSPFDIPNRPKTVSAIQDGLPASQATRIKQDMVYTDATIETWQYPDDHYFASEMLNKHFISDDETELCADCTNLDMMASELEFKNSSLQSNIDECSLCLLVSKVVAGTALQWQESFRLLRDADHFVFREEKKAIKLLRVCCASYDPSLDHTKVSVGARQLFIPPRDPRSGSSFWELPKAWLKQCDESHGKVCGQTNQQFRLPHRLIDVRRPKLVDSEELDGKQDQIRYIAFSHKWGKESFSVTTIENIDDRKKRILKKELPKSFTEVIAVTKALGCDYLWIDSLCINQGDGGDFDEQAENMQTVYSNAYCVIAASSANGATEGFLARDSELNQLDAVKVDKVFVSATTNDFTRDVLQSPLHRRGWVLQEHALARRTIFFTATQMYWECGDGIRCETLRKLKHDDISLLGDAHFPSKAIEEDGTRGRQIRLWTTLFKDYALLELTRPPDRSVAIEGLMARLADAFKTDSLFGLFKSFWGRCLLWRRPPGGAPMRRVQQEWYSIKLAPTWSWMAVLGGIDFLRPKGGEVDWNSSDIDLPPALEGKMAQDQRKTLPQRPTDSIAQGDEIKATAYRLTSAARSLDEQKIHYDDDAQRADGKVRAVIICTSKNKHEHHVLLVSEATRDTIPPTYERVGVALLPETCIDRASGIRIAIG